jgi:hypothetical protein
VEVVEVGEGVEEAVGWEAWAAEDGMQMLEVEAWLS